MKLDRLKKEMKTVERKYAIYPLVESRIFETNLHNKYNKLGYAGVNGTLKYTPEFPNDEKAWEEVAKVFDNFIKNDMSIIIYDEYGYPSGTARGVVPESNPNFIAKGLYCYVHWKHIEQDCFYKGNIPNGEFYKALLVGAESGKIYDVSDCVDENGNLKMFTPKSAENYDLVLLVTRRLFEGTHATHNECEIRNYISMSDAEATKKFIEVTHENYYKYAGTNFGKGIKAFFTDEPSLMSYALVPQLMPILPWMPYYPEEFKNRYGYNFEDAVCAVLLHKGEENAKRRCDFWEYISETVSNGYFGTIKKWCREHGVASTGHLLSEENLQDHIVNYGSYYETLKSFDWPGIDMLGTISEQLMVECVPFARIASSVADLYGCGEALSEFSDIKTYYSGVYVSIDEYYKSVNWHTAMGVNNFVSLYAFRDGEGRPFPAEDVRALNEYTARLNKIMRMGIRNVQVGLLYPDTSMWANYNANTNYHAIDSAPAITKINNVFCKAAWELFHRQIDFDVIDNNLVLNSTVEGTNVLFGNRKFKEFIIPCCDVLKEAVATCLLEWIEQGIKVTFVEKVPSVSRETGKLAAFKMKFETAVQSGQAKIISISEFEDAENVTSIALPFYISNGRENRFQELLSHMRVLEDGSCLILIVNMGKEDFIGRLNVQGSFSSINSFDPRTGGFSDVNFSFNNDRSTLDLTIEAGKAKVLFFNGRDEDV